MANIDITLLTSKRTRISVDGLDSVAATQAGGYIVVAGESEVTTFGVHFPSNYIGQTSWVYMKNSKGEYKVKHFGTLQNADVTFTLPGEMTVAGNTYLVFYATYGEGESAIKTVWAPIVVPVASTGIDYRKVAVASPDVLEQVITEAGEAIRIAQSVREDADKGVFDGKSAFVRFSASENGTNMTSEWSAGQNYLGLYIGNEASEDPQDYNWTRFVGGSFCEDDGETNEVNYVIEDNTDMSFISENITSVKLTIPENIHHGYHAGVNFVSGSTAPTFEVINNSEYTIKIIQYGFVMSAYTPSANCSVSMSIICDGKFVHLSILEVAE